MAGTSQIEWTDATWNPVVGCSIVSPGCTNCYAMKLAPRLQATQHHYSGTVRNSNGGPVWTGKVARAHDGILTAPLHWLKPRRIFVNSMGDLFHESIPDEWIDKVFAVMALCPRHTFQVLTKRADRMREYVAVRTAGGRHIWPAAQSIEMPRGQHKRENSWPFGNVWLGVSAERQKEADERREPLRALAEQGWTTFCSYEPALGPINWAAWQFLRWLISGGESGRKARPSHPDWHRAARDWCEANGVAYFFKQWGCWAPSTEERASGNPRSGWQANRAHPCVAKAHELYPGAGAAFVEYVGKKSAGRLLDGVEHSAFPGVSS